MVIEKSGLLSTVVYGLNFCILLWVSINLLQRRTHFHPLFPLWSHLVHFCKPAKNALLSRLLAQQDQKVEEASLVSKLCSQSEKRTTFFFSSAHFAFSRKRRKKPSERENHSSIYADYLSCFLPPMGPDSRVFLLRKWFPFRRKVYCLEYSLWRPLKVS